MTKEEFIEKATYHWKEIINAYKELGEDDYITAYWLNGKMGIMNNNPKNDVPDIAHFEDYC